MKRLALLLPLLLVGCASQPKATDYSFELTNEIITSSIELDDETNEYSSSCDRRGKVQYRLEIQPKNFTGAVAATASSKIGSYLGEEYGLWLYVINGKMLPYSFAFYSYSNASRLEEFKAVCSIKEVKDFEYLIDNSTVIMLPGVHPSLEEKS